MGKIRTGANVRLLNEVGEGVVSGYTKDNRVLVLMSDGFEIPYFEKELVVIGEASASSVSQTNAVIVSDSKQHMQEALYMAFVLSGISKDSPIIDIQLLNKRKEPMHYILYSEVEKKFTLESRGELSSMGLKSMAKLALPDLLAKDRFYIQIQPFTTNPEAPLMSWSGFIKHQTPQIIEPPTWPMIEDLASRALLIQVYPDKGLHAGAVRNKESENAGKMLKATQDWLLKEGRDGRFEVDLHIEEILENTAGMDNAEIIRFQLRYFEKCLDEARRRPMKRFVAIHGVGKGRLRDEIRKLLSAEDIEHYDAPLSKYGYGATEIIVK